MMNETDKKNAIINCFKQMIASWSCLNASPTMNVLTLNCLDPECEKIIAEAYKDYISYESPICYYFNIGGKYATITNSI